MFVAGTPIGGEDRREADAVAAIAAAALVPGCRGVSLAFTLEPGRRVDVDNLARPVLAGLRDAGWFARGFSTLDHLLVTKSAGTSVGVAVDVVPGVVASASEPALQLALKGIVPGPGHREHLRLWRDAVGSTSQKPALTGSISVEIEVDTRRSLVDLMKPIIDGLAPSPARRRLLDCLRSTQSQLPHRRTHAPFPPLTTSKNDLFRFAARCESQLSYRR